MDEQAKTILDQHLAKALVDGDISLDEWRLWKSESTISQEMAITLLEKAKVDSLVPPSARLAVRDKRKKSDASPGTEAIPQKATGGIHPEVKSVDGSSMKGHSAACITTCAGDKSEAKAIHRAALSAIKAAPSPRLD